MFENVFDYIPGNHSNQPPGPNVQDQSNAHSKYHHTKIYRKISRVCCRLYAPWVTMPMPTNKWYLFFLGIAWYYGDNDFTFNFIARSDVNTWLILPDMDSHMTCNFYKLCTGSPWDSHTFAVRHWCWLPVNTVIEKWAKVTTSLFFYQWKLPAFHSKATFTFTEFHESILTSMSGELAFSYCSSCKDRTAPRQHTNTQ